MGTGRRIRRMLRYAKMHTKKLSSRAIPRCLVCNRRLLFPILQAEYYSPFLVKRIPRGRRTFRYWHEGLRNGWVCKECLE